MSKFRLLASTHNDEKTEAEIKSIISQKVGDIVAHGRACFVVTIFLSYSDEPNSPLYMNYYILHDIFKLRELIEELRDAKTMFYMFGEHPEFYLYRSIDVKYMRYQYVGSDVHLDIDSEYIEFELEDRIETGSIKVYSDRIEYFPGMSLSDGVKMYSIFLNKDKFRKFNREVMSTSIDVFKTLINKMVSNYDELVHCQNHNGNLGFPHSDNYFRASKLQLVHDDYRFKLSRLLDNGIWNKIDKMPENEFMNFANNLAKYSDHIKISEVILSRSS